MGRPAMSLDQLITAGTYRSRREANRELLAGPASRWPLFADLQRQYVGAGSEPQRRAIALKVEQHMRAAHKRLLEQTAAASPPPPRLELAGKAGSLAQLVGFFPAYLAHPKGPLLGKPFALAPFQQRFLKEFYRR